jgi:vanillate O-demethylase ferredoxin subunit
MNSPFRNNLLIVHRWSGLTMGFVIAFLAITGALFVLRPSIDQFVNGDLHDVAACSQRMPLDVLAGLARGVHPAAKLHSIEVSTAATSSIAVKFTDKDYVYLNPCSGAVLGVQNQYGGLFGVADSLHRFRFMEGGRVFAGWNNVAFLLLMVIGGLYLWWPRRGQRLKSALKFNPRLPGSARTINLHKVVGIYSSLVLLAITLTALPISFEPVQDLFYQLTGSHKLAKPPRSTPLEGAHRLPMEQFWQTSKLAFPNQEWVSIRYPVKPADPVAFEVLERGTPHEIAKSYLYLDAYSGATMGLLHYDTDIPLGRKIYLYCIALHSGLVGGLPYQILLLLACLGTAVLAYSGASPYLRRKLRKPSSSMMTLKLARKVVEADGICSFELVDPAGKQLPPFSAGSHIDVQLAPGLVRQYSLCNDPAETGRYLIGVQLAPDSRGGSRALHALECGARLAVSAPKNHFPLEHAATRSLLFAGGIGITPILCMAERLANSGAQFELHYSARRQSRAAFFNRIAASGYGERVSFYFGDDGGGPVLDLGAILAGPAAGTHLYVCGPQGYMDAVIAAARDAGWDEGQIHREYFSGMVEHREADLPFDVKLASSGKVIHVAKHQTVLAALTACGVDVQASCAEGVCGSCLTRVLEGQPEHRDVFLTAADRARNDRFLPCCSRSNGPMLILDL